MLVLGGWGVSCLGPETSLGTKEPGIPGEAWRRMGDIMSQRGKGPVVAKAWLKWQIPGGKMRLEVRH